MFKKEYICVVALMIAIIALGVAWNIDTNPISFSGSTSDNWSVGGNLTVAGTSSLTGAFSGTSATFSSGIVLDTGSITATTTLTSTSDNYQFFPASANAITVTLPAATDGLRYEFLVTGALTGGFVTIDSAEGDNIYGILMVNDADVVCDAEDQIDIVTDGEVIGDRVELISDGTNWYILDSDVDAAGKMTCTNPS